ncbi:hypothetical protein SBOR_6365 [Sclerotinia borealis F-4128]|uniref:Zn(2)-C6 fungal-type domain-containing protein n=1 Tax=Sclerotinia borealis (strain F-4128) TaxID=1432307 RepID=W9CFF1_SCLBF|nr:hypothetical protein SBOR_6365 [Sclerotinia borealis F-4128]
MPISHEIKPPKGSKQVARKRKRDSTSSEHSIPTSSPESGKRNKRATRACERCRNKKIKCDIERDIACNACVDANVVCEAGNGKHTEDKKYPPGYTESLENTYQAMILVVDKLWRMLKNGEEWTFAEPRMKDEGKGPVVIHDIAQALGCIRNASSLPESFVEDAPALLTRLSLEEKMIIKQEPPTEVTISTEEPSPEFQIKSPKSSPEFKVESPLNYPCQFPQISEIDLINQTKSSFTLQFQPSNNPPSLASISRLAARDQKLSASRMSLVSFIGSKSKNQVPNVNMSHSHVIDKLASNFPSDYTFNKRVIQGTMAHRRAPGLTIQPQSYHFQEISALSASSTVSSLSPTYSTDSLFQSNVSPFSPAAYQANSPLSSSGDSYQVDCSMSSSPYLSTLHEDPYLSPIQCFDNFSNPHFHEHNTSLFDEQAASDSFDGSPCFGNSDSSYQYGTGFGDLNGLCFSAEDELIHRDLMNNT